MYQEHLRALGVEPPNVFKIRTLRLEGVMIDVLHCLDQGVSAHLIANVFVEVMALRHWGTNPAAQVAGLEANMRKWQKEQGEKIIMQGDLTWSRIRTTNDWPKLAC